LNEKIKQTSETSTKNTITATDLPVKNENNDMLKFRVKIDGIPEISKEVKPWDRQNHEKSAIKKIFDFLKLENVLLTDSFRVGKYVSESKRPRSVIATVSSVWDRNKILQSAPLLKSYCTATYISPALSNADRILERRIMKKRWELIEKGADRKNLKIKNLKLYNNNEIVNISDE